MALSNYADLQTAIITYAFRVGDTDFAAMCPTFIALCESRVNKTLRIRQMETSATVTMTNGVGTLPADYLQYREVLANGPHAYPLKVTDPNTGQGDYPLSDYPAYFAVIGNTIKTFPASTVDLTLNYFEKIPALSDADDTNWLLEKAPEVYLYGSLMEAAPFMMDDGRISTWAQFYEGAMVLLRQEDEMAKYARASSRVRGPTP